MITNSLPSNKYALGGNRPVVKLEHLNARDTFRQGIELMQQSSRLMGSLLPGAGMMCDFQELDRKFEAFRLFQYATRELGAEGERLPLDEAVARALRLEPFRAIWVLEGIGHFHAGRAGLTRTGLLQVSLPEQAMIPLHAGMGTAFAENLLARLGSNPPASLIQQTVERFLKQCVANCQRGWEDACIEPIGLVVRCLYPSLLTAVSDEMGACSPALRRLFWHGVGRSLYFVPSNFLPIPGAHLRMLRSARDEAPGEADRQNVLAGLVWAVTLVNLPYPAVLRSLLAPASDLKMRDAATNGVISALMAWRHMQPGEPRNLAPYQDSSLENGDLWNNWVRIPARQALANIYPGLERSNRIPALYTFRTSEQLDELSRSPVETA